MKDLTKEMYFLKEQGTSLKEIEQLANELLATTWKIDIFRQQAPREINLKSLSWKFEFNSRKRAAGLCSKNEKTIYISRWLLEQNLSKGLEFEDTLRHEIAHANDFEIRGTSDHGRVWKLIARQVLCTAERCFKSEQISVTETTKYTLICDSCGTQSPRHKATKKKGACVKCCNAHNGGRFSERFLIRQIQNY
ncbi:MAG: SprT-like domain-containing protein [Bacteroidota bacterium]